MRMIASLTTIVLLVAAGICEAGQFGPSTPTAAAGQISQEAGYLHSKAKWTTGKGEPFDDGVLTQNQAYLQAGYSLAPLWEGYVRIGGADAELENAFADPGDSSLTDGIMPFIALGVRGLLYESEHFDVGAFLQGSYFAPYEASKKFVDPDFGPFVFEETLKLKHLWEANVGVTVQGSVSEDLVVYAGPLFYFGQGKLYTEVESADLPGLTGDSRGSYEMDGVVGAVAGVSLGLGPHLSLNLEGDYRGKEFSFGASVSYLRFDP